MTSSVELLGQLKQAIEKATGITVINLRIEPADDGHDVYIKMDAVAAPVVKHVAKKMLPWEDLDKTIDIEAIRGEARTDGYDKGYEQGWKDAT